MQFRKTFVYFTFLALLISFSQITCTISAPPQASTGNPGTEKTFSLSVACHRDQSFSDTNVDIIFAEASKLLQTVQYTCLDVACPTTFERDGSLRFFDSASTYVTTEAQLDAIFDEPGDFKVVTMMSGVCGVPASSSMSEILGCAYRSGSVVIVSHAPADVWAHEWGHVQGLDHRDDCETNIMHSYELQTDALNTAEKNAFLSNTPTSPFFKAIQPVQSESSPEDSTCFLEETLENQLRCLVSRRYLIGLPATVIAPFKDNDEARQLLISILESSDDSVELTNAIRILGLLGNPEAVPAVISLIDGINEPITREDISVVNEGLFALGRLSGPDSSSQAINYLIDGSAPDFWISRGIGQNHPENENSESTTIMSDLFTRLSIMSLGLSQHPAARNHLLALQKTIITGKLSGPWFTEQVAEALARLNGEKNRERQISQTFRTP